MLAYKSHISRSAFECFADMHTRNLYQQCIPGGTVLAQLTGRLDFCNTRFCCLRLRLTQRRPCSTSWPSLSALQLLSVLHASCALPCKKHRRHHTHLLLCNTACGTQLRVGSSSYQNLYNFHMPLHIKHCSVSSKEPCLGPIVSRLARSPPHKLDAKRFSLLHNVYLASFPAPHTILSHLSSSQE